MRRAPCALEVRRLGAVDYAEALELQRRLAEARARGEIEDTLLLAEHPPVVTCGRGFSPHSLRQTPYPVFHVERGGDVTYHGPGQLVGYPIVDLKNRGLTVGAYLRLLEDGLIDAVGRFGLEAERVKGFTGVWSRGRKIASIGVSVRRWVAYHGFALNVRTDLSALRGLFPCGLEPSQMASMAELLGQEPDLSDVSKAVEQSFFRRWISD